MKIIVQTYKDGEKSIFRSQSWRAKTETEITSSIEEIEEFIDDSFIEIQDDEGFRL